MELVLEIRTGFDPHRVVRLLNWLVGENVVLLRERPLPLLYDTHVVYAIEQVETLSDCHIVYAQGKDDCDSLGAWRAAELIVYGYQAMRPGDAGYELAQQLRPASIKAEAILTTQQVSGPADLYHCITQYTLGGQIFHDDPSERLGMSGRFDPFVLARRSIA
jgi:hypothetical protein